MKTVAIIGANGYVGSHLVNLLAPLFQVTALNRSEHSIGKKVAGVTYAVLHQPVQTFDFIINTAYSIAKEPQLFRKENTQLLQRLQQLSGPHTRIIHLSSLAVFGFGLDIPIRPQVLPYRSDYPYVSSKLHMEHRLLEGVQHSQLSIIRLGNVWGPANPSWTQPVSDAILWGLPVRSKQAAYSNLTYIHNITSYINHLMQRDQQQLFHHLAEFNQITWPQIVDEIGAHLHLQPQAIDTIPFYPKNLLAELTHAVSGGPVQLLRELKSGRYTANLFPVSLQKMLMGIRSALQSGIHTQPLPPYQTDPVFYWVLNAHIPFANHVVNDWEPPYNWEQANKETLNWLTEAGYVS